MKAPTIPKSSQPTAEPTIHAVFAFGDNCERGRRETSMTVHMTKTSDAA